MNLDLGFYWRLFIRRLPAMMAIVIVCSVIGAVVALRAPTTFRTEARLIVEDPQIPGELASSTVRTTATAAIEVIRQQLLTRSTLLDIANEFDVFEDYSAVEPDQIVQHMQRNTTIRSSGGGRTQEPVIVTVAFEARRGIIAADVVNEYVTRIVNANVELRMGRAEDTLDFFEQEVQRLARELDQQNAQITQFQVENADALPDEQPFRLSRLALLQERITNAERERTSLLDQRARIVEIFQATGTLTGAGGVPLTPEQQELAALERELADALLIFAENSPRVLPLQRRVEQLRARIQASGGDTEDGAGTGDGQVDEPVGIMDIQLAEIDSQIAAIDAAITQTQQEVVELEDSIARTPLNTITLRSLERDYENIRRQYDNVLVSLAEASTGERIEVTARGQRISIIEAANVPREPFRPNRTRIMAAGVAAGIGLAGGLFVLLELLNRAVRRPVEITNALGITPLASIPYLETQRRRAVRRAMRMGSFAVILIGVPVALWAIDTYFLPLDQLAQQVLRRVGLS
ncbi:MAG: lipopolysaccharide biosynthesis [Pseudomonadota bacterium]